MQSQLKHKQAYALEMYDLSQEVAEHWVRFSYLSRYVHYTHGTNENVQLFKEKDLTKKED